MDKLPQDSPENESLESVVSEESALHLQDYSFQGRLGLQVEQDGSTNLVSWDTSAYDSHPSYPYVTLTRQDTVISSDSTQLLKRSPKYPPPYPDNIANVSHPGHKYAYTVFLADPAGSVGHQQTVYVWISPGAPIMPSDPIFSEEVSPIGEKSPVERIHESPAVDIPSVASEEHLQE